MYKDKTIAVIIPAHNEAQFIASVIHSIPPYVDYIIVVDDASRDDTSAQARASGDPRLTVLRNETNLGVGGAMVRGYQQALTLDSDIIVKVDGDGQMPLDHLEALLQPIVSEGYAYTKGNRFLESATLENMPYLRWVGNILLTFLTKLASGYWHVFDPQNGFTAISAAALRSLNLPRIYQGFFFENDMLVQLNIRHYRVKDVPMPTIYGEEQSDLHIRKVIFVFSRLLINRFFYRIYQKYILRDFSPIVIFLFIGTLMIVWGTVFGGYHWLQSIRTNTPATTGTVMLAAMPFILGFQLLLQAIVLDIQETPR